MVSSHLDGAPGGLFQQRIAQNRGRDDCGAAGAGYSREPPSGARRLRHSTESRRGSWSEGTAGGVPRLEVEDAVLVARHQDPYKHDELGLGQHAGCSGREGWERLRRWQSRDSGPQIPTVTEPPSAAFCWALTWGDRTASWTWSCSPCRGSRGSSLGRPTLKQ